MEYKKLYKRGDGHLKKSMLVQISIGLALLMSTLVGCSTLTSTKASHTITVVGKNFTEQDLLANLVGLMLEKNTDLNVKVTSYLGGTDVCFHALKNGKADVYVEYTGTGFVNILGKSAISDPQQVYNTVKTEFSQKFQLEWLKPLGFNNTYAIAVTQETAKKYHLKTVSDLKAHAGELTFGTEQEFLERPDGLKGLEKTYGLKFKEVKAMDIGLKYKALTEGQVDVIDSFSTDGRIPKNNLVLLQDDQRFFPPYYAAPLVRSETLKKYPQVEEVLNRLAGKIDDHQMALLNEEVDVEKKKAKDVANDWLMKEGLIK
jgi:osmoprotectant transport system substrate-binding protein